MTDEYKAARDAANEKHYDTCQPPWADHFNAGADWAYSYAQDQQKKQCACGDVMLADTEDWSQPLCCNCHDLAKKHFQETKDAQIETLTAESVQDAATISMLEGQVETKDKQIALLTEAMKEIANNGLEFETPDGYYVVDSNPIEVAQKALAKSLELGK